jgi:hypothetical protein
MHIRPHGLPFLGGYMRDSVYDLWVVVASLATAGVVILISLYFYL